LKINSVSKIFLPFIAQILFSSDIKIFANSQTSASNFKSFSRALEQFYLKVGQNNLGNKMSLLFLELIIPIVDGGPSEGAVHVKEGS
jgi:hypothetical protein